MIRASPMGTLPSSTEKQTASEPGFRLWFIVVMLLVPLMGPVLGSEGWAKWDEGRRLWKVAKWVMDIGISLGVVFIPSVRHMFRLLIVFPWMFAVGFGFALVVGINSGQFSAPPIARIAYVGFSSAAWFAFLRRYPFVVQPYKYSDAEWRRLTTSSAPKTAQ
jgi:hypothetical protein